MSGADIDISLARSAGPARRSEILNRARECYTRAGALVHRAEALARAGRISRDPVTEATLRADLTLAGLRLTTARNIL
jgi:hypothetical protein